ncbi:hypothetical protein [Gordonibacter urolithinfaciens]|uniref:Uncharacterized protein n=1 Tax=Gordonibacter urolithinfaciens TaxID=1335613 RepID=A0A6N8IK40_9ACTN|nr:hypothetical protein [Gordonibacter urolithinfaciens]MVM55798.1 hypothetical protein [Gordonibacter urolithinfaciens]MVN16205.1 hypothetical protein [Gordonibacter urolithinfaciens]MVN39533.1 hypothetical protein [Gordonibacter urolithinfaciens]MVN56839.1 hypothetical protein [Gordonibacter urolithinfaciens]MVN60935.1 hypothetical protein [Gordonibacter urolithinfaciens]
MQLSFLVAKALLEGDFASYFASLPSADDEPEPIVLREGKFERVSRMEHEERGTVAVAVLVVREVAATVEADAIACEKWIRAYGWEPVAENGSWRIVGLDTTAPSFKEIDGSGRFVWAFDVLLTVVRGI